MSLTEYERLQILKWFEEAMGPDLGANTMKLFPPVGWGDIATKTDLNLLEHGLRAEMAMLRSELRGEMADLRAELRGEMAELRAELRGEMAELRADLHGEMAELRGEMNGLPGSMAKTFVTWLLASQAAVIAVIGALVGFFAG